MSARTREPFVSYDTLPQLLLAGLIGAVLGLAVLLGRPSWLLGLAALGGLAMVVYLRADVVLLAMLIATSSVVPEGLLPSVVTPVGRFYAPDVMLLAAFAALVLRWLLEARPGPAPSPLSAPLLAFYGLALLGVAAAVARSAITLTTGLREVRVVTYYLAFFLVTHLVGQGPRLRTLLRGVMLAATLVAAAMVAQFVVGATVPLLPGRVETLYTEGVQHIGVTRVLPPGQSLVLAALILQSAALVVDRLSPGRVLGYIRWGLLGLAVLLTFNRSFWVAVFIALALLGVVLAGEERRRLAVWGLVTAAAAIIVALALSGHPGSPGERLVAASLERAASLGRTETFVQPGSSLGWRGVEYEYALPQIASRPLLGLGLGAEYRPWDERLDSDAFDGRYYIHNAHLWILLKVGWPGYACLLWWSFLFLGRALRRWRGIGDPEPRAVVLGSGVLYAGVLAASLVNPILIQWSWTPVLAVLMGCSEAIVVGERHLG